MAAGCTQASSLSKVMLYDIIEHMHGVFHHPISTYIDDVAQEVVGESDEYVSNEAVRVARCFTTMVKARKLSISSKSLVTASSASLRNSIHEKFKCINVHIKQVAFC